MKNIHKFETGTLIDLRQVMGISMLQFSTVIQGGSGNLPNQAFVLLYMEGGPQRVDLLAASGIKSMTPSAQAVATPAYHASALTAYELLVNQWMEIVSPTDLKQLQQTRIIEEKPKAANPAKVDVAGAVKPEAASTPTKEP